MNSLIRDVRLRRSCVFATLAITTLTLLVTACQTPPVDPISLVEKGEQIFLNETFEGNGRTCASCHRPTDNFEISPAFLATLRDDDPVFVAETNPNLSANFENPRLMREIALILENQDGFDDLENNFNMRGVPHTLAMRSSIDSRVGPRTGWSGDGAPGDGSLKKRCGSSTSSDTAHRGCPPLVG